MKHTPAPWTKNEWENGNTDINIGAIGTPLIATVKFRDVSLNELEANARLISCAPELLEALKEALEIAREPDSYRSMEERETAIINWKIQAKKAISKAIGE